jgi:hypothetical protein
MNESPYRNLPGFKESGTSKEAAERIQGKAALLRDRCLTLLKQRPMTADEVAGALNESILSVRPRISELFHLKLIFKTQQRRTNKSGMSAVVWTTIHTTFSAER